MPYPSSVPPSLARSRLLANTALISAAALWVFLLFLEPRLPEHTKLISIFILAAEAGVVGGMADWYAVTVLFRNPFGKLPLPRLLLQHTAIIPRNKARIAESMGRFVQENFLAGHIVGKSLRKTDISMTLGAWLLQEGNAEKITTLLQRIGPRLLQVFESRDIEVFIQQNAAEWIKSTPLHLMSSEVLRAVLKNDFHHEALQRGLDAADKWIKAHPEKAREMAATVFEELGVGGLTRGAGWIGIDVQRRTLNTFMAQVEKLLEDREHPWRVALEKSARVLMQDFRKRNSLASQHLNAAKNSLADSEPVMSFITSAVVILRDAIKHDLQRKDSGLASNMKEVLLRLGHHLQTNPPVRAALNHEIEEIAVAFTHDYADAIITYVSEQIHEWDTREMIAKIETEVGGDLHMIRVNGVVMGAFIGMLLGSARVLIDYVSL